MSKQREAFEAAYAEMMNAQAVEARWGISPYTPAEIASMREGESYKEGRHVLHACWTLWQASRAAALEEAAEICEEIPKRYGVHSNFIAAKLIRALKEQS